MYQSFDNVLLPRTTTGATIDLGAYEFNGATGVAENKPDQKILVFPDPSHGRFKVQIDESDFSKHYRLEIYYLNGFMVYALPDLKIQTDTEIDLSKYSKGAYVMKIYNGTEIIDKRIFIL